MFNWKIKTFEKVERPDIIDIIASTSEWKILILEEKQPWRDVFYWLVGWTCENNENPIETAKRELIEETWMISDDWEKFWSFKISSKLAYESHIFIAKNCKKITNQDLEIWENIWVFKTSISEFEKMISDWKVLSSKTAYCFLLAKLKKIF